MTPVLRVSEVIRDQELCKPLVGCFCNLGELGLDHDVKFLRCVRILHLPRESVWL